MPERPDALVPRTVGFRLAQLGAETARRFHEVMRGHDLEPRQFGVLRVLSSLDGPTQQELGQLLRIPPSSMVALLDELEGRGLVGRRTHPNDRRAHVVALTPAGRRAVERALRSAMSLERELCAGLSAGEREQLLDLLSKVADTVQLGPAVPDPGIDPGAG